MAPDSLTGGAYRGYERDSVDEDDDNNDDNDDDDGEDAVVTSTGSTTRMSMLCSAQRQYMSEPCVQRPPIRVCSLRVRSAAAQMKMLLTDLGRR